MDRFGSCSDEELLELALEDAAAFAVFYDRHEDRLLAFFRHATGRADLAADLAAEVFACMLESLEHYRRELGDAQAWMYGIARHELAQTWRRGAVEARARRRLGIDAMVISDDDLARIDELDEAASLDLLGLVDELPDQQREALTGRIVQERDYAELASELGCSELVVRKRVSRGLGRLRTAIARKAR
ncbi:MAG: RNA polymerase sigma factor [Solirubrobacteraceae bacterium]